MEPHRQTLDQRLRAGDAKGALDAAAQWAEASEATPRDTAIEIAKAAGAVYRDLLPPEPVHEFVEGVADAIPGTVGATVAKAVGRLVELALEWEAKVRSCYEERLARELRDFVRAKDWASAMRNLGALCESSSGDDEDRRARVSYAGNVLGTLVHQPNEAKYLATLAAREPDAVGLTPALADLLEKSRESRHQQMMGVDMANVENQWTATLRSVQAEAMHVHPRKNEMGEPDEDDLRVVGDMYRSILRVPLLAHTEDMFTDAVLLITDFLPRAPGRVAAGHGVEGRAFTEMGFRARKAAVLCLADIGKSEAFAKRFLSWAKPAAESGANPGRIIEMLGAMRHPSYAPVLVGWWSNRALRDRRPELVAALASLATPEAAEILLAELERLLADKAESFGEFASRVNVSYASLKTSAKGVDAGKFKQAMGLVTALGRIARSPRTDDEAKRSIVQRVVDLAPPDERRFNAAVATALLAAAPDAVLDRDVGWAVSALVDGLWVPDQSHALQAEADRSDTALGARAPLVKALARLGKRDIKAVVNALDRKAGTVGGAFPAAAEALEQLGDPKGVPVLEKMALAALTQELPEDDPSRKETVWDPATRTRVPLTQDAVTAPVIHALGTIGGPEAQAALEHIRDRIQSGRCLPPGTETMRFLQRFAGIAAKPAAKEPAADGAKAAGAPASALDDEQRREAAKHAKTLRSSMLLKGAAKKAQLRIEALARLAALRDPDALEAIEAHLGSSNPMVQSAAVAAMAAYGALDQPIGMLDQVFGAMRRALASDDDARRKAAAKLLKEIGPHRREVRSRIAAWAKQAGDGPERVQLSRMLDSAGFDSAGPSASDDAPASAAPDPRATRELQKLSAKQEYFRARQEWLSSGKKGPEPVRPPDA